MIRVGFAEPERSFPSARFSVDCRSFQRRLSYFIGMFQR